MRPWAFRDSSDVEGLRFWAERGARAERSAELLQTTLRFDEHASEPRAKGMTVTRLRRGVWPLALALAACEPQRRSVPDTEVHLGPTQDAGAGLGHEPAPAQVPSSAPSVATFAEPKTAKPVVRTNDGHCTPEPKEGTTCAKGQSWCVLSWGQPGGHSSALWCRDGRWRREEEVNLP